MKPLARTAAAPLFAALALLLPAAAQAEDAPPPASATPRIDLSVPPPVGGSYEVPPDAIDWEKVRRMEEEWEGNRYYTEVPPQPADGVYTVSAELPTVACFWLFPVELRAGEDYPGFIRRAWDEYYGQARRTLVTVVNERKTFYHVMENPELPEVSFRGWILRNPAAPEGCREVSLPAGRESYAEEGGPCAEWYNLVLSVEFTAEGITAREGRRADCGLNVATAAARRWPWSEAADFLAALPQMMQGKPEDVEICLPYGAELTAPLRERICSGRRLLLFYGAEGLPMSEYWETYAKMVEVAGALNVAYCHTPHPVLGKAQYDARVRQMEREPWGDTDPEPTLAPSLPDLPQPDIQPSIELGEG